MQLELENQQNPNAIRNYQSGSIQVGEKVYQHDLIISATAITPWENANFEHLDVNKWLEHEPDLILVGTGETMQYIKAETQALIQQHNIGIEFMPTAAACRTFNVLLAENRNVLALLKVV